MHRLVQGVTNQLVNIGLQQTSFHLHLPWNFNPSPSIQPTSIPLGLRLQRVHHMIESLGCSASDGFKLPARGNLLTAHAHLFAFSWRCLLPWMKHQSESKSLKPENMQTPLSPWSNRSNARWKSHGIQATIAFCTRCRKSTSSEVVVSQWLQFSSSNYQTWNLLYMSGEDR